MQGTRKWIRETVVGRWRLWAAGGALGLVVLMAGQLYGRDPAKRSVRVDPAAHVERLTAKAESLKTDFDQVTDYYRSEVVPMERVLLRYRDDPALVRRISVALVREANRTQVEPRLLLAVLLVENPWLKPRARSPVGAVGLMQVMPVHDGQWGCGSNLEDIDTNICHGARIFANDLRRTGGDVERALLRYNGCVHGTNTPDCQQYPNRVFAKAGRAAILAWLTPRTLAAAAP
jgi:soluble lytic murein transglycosylase-like protein